MYDAPPRTRSRLVSRTIYECLRTQQFTFADALENVSAWNVLPNMLALHADKVAVTSGALYVDREMVRHLHTHCKRLHYITSTNSMTRRLAQFALAAVAEYSPEAKRLLELGRNWSDAQLALLARVARDVSRQVEEAYEAYPFACVEEAVLGEGILTPDAVIRTEQLEKDLSSLLDVFECDASQIAEGHPARRNVSSEISDELESGLDSSVPQKATYETLVSQVWSRFAEIRLPLRFKDARHRRLTTLPIQYSRLRP